MAPPPTRYPGVTLTPVFPSYPSPFLCSAPPFNQPISKFGQLHLLPPQLLPRPSHHPLFSIPSPSSCSGAQHPHIPLPCGAGGMESHQFPAYSLSVLPDTPEKILALSTRLCLPTLSVPEPYTRFCGIFLLAAPAIPYQEMDICSSLCPDYSAPDLPMTGSWPFGPCCTAPPQEGHP